MLKTSKWDNFVRDGHKPLTPEQRHALATAPFPAVRIVTPLHSAHAMGWRRSALDRVDTNASADIVMGGL